MSATATPVARTAQTKAFQPYLPRLVLDWQRAAPDARYQEIEGSMVFVDVSGFTKMSERLARQGKVGAEEVSDVINDTFTALLAQAYANGGGLLKFGGDALLLFFSGDGHALRATAAAHGMRAELRRIGTFTTSAGKVVLRMSVGAHTGLFHFFLVGGSHRELIVAGPAATETVTMEGAASAGQILLSPALAAALPARNRGRELGPGVLLRGAPPAVESIPVERVSTDLDLTPFVSRGLRETVQQGEVEPEHRHVTIAFVHYGGFDDLVRDEGAAVAAEALDDLVRTAQRAVDERGIAFLATDVAPDGGKIILTAGAPVVTGADEEGMLLALRDVVAADTSLPLHVGVNTGPVFAGVIGPSYRRTYTVMGDAVNLSARLMAKAEHGQVVATPQVLDGSRTLFETASLEPFLVKGKKHPIEAFVVGEPRGSRTSIAEAGLPLIGRDEELATLEGAWARSAGGDGTVVELSAEPGMGKSRLLGEFLSRHDEVDVLRGECRLYQAATPYFPLRTILRDAFGLGGLADEDAATALASLVRESAPQLQPWLSLIGTALDLELPPSREVEELEDEFRRTRLEQAVTGLLAATVTEPSVILIEDTHWMDEPSRDLIERLTSDLDGRPWLVLLSTRPSDRAGEGDSVIRIALEPLDPSHAVALIDAATEHEPLMPQQVRSLAERAAGNPLFLLELLDALRRGEDVDALPHSVEGLIQARIDRLPPADRTRLREVAVLGAGFRVEHVASALADGRSTTLIRAALDRLGDFLGVDATGWAQFHHALIRDAAYEGLPYAKRKAIHARVGDSILAAAGDAPDEQAELLSLHYSAAGRWKEAWTYSRIAGDEARAVYANVEAARFYERALAATRRLDGVENADRAAVVASLGDVCLVNGEHLRARDAYRLARRLFEGEPIGESELYLKQATVSLRTRNFPEMIRWLNRGLRVLEGIDSDEAMTARARLLLHVARARRYQGRLVEAVDWSERTIAAAEAAGDEARESLAGALFTRDQAYTQLGRLDLAKHMEVALAIFEDVGSPSDRGGVLLALSNRAYATGDWSGQLDLLRHALEAFEQSGDTWGSGLVAYNLAERLVEQGRTSEAEPIARNCVRLWKSAKYDADAAEGMSLLGQVLGRLGRFDEATEALQEAHRGLSDAGEPADELRVDVRAAECLVLRGEGSAALRAVQQSLERASITEGGSSLVASLYRLRGWALTLLRRYTDARAAFDASLAEARGDRNESESGSGLWINPSSDYELALTHDALAQLADATGDDGTRDARIAHEIFARLDVIGVSRPPQAPVVAQAESPRAWGAQRAPQAD